VRRNRRGRRWPTTRPAGGRGYNAAEKKSGRSSADVRTDKQGAAVSKPNASTTRANQETHPIARRADMSEFAALRLARNPGGIDRKRDCACSRAAISLLGKTCALGKTRRGGSYGMGSPSSGAFVCSAVPPLGKRMAEGPRRSCGNSAGEEGWVLQTKVLNKPSGGPRFVYLCPGPTRLIVDLGHGASTTSRQNDTRCGPAIVTIPGASRPGGRTQTGRDSAGGTTHVARFPLLAIKRGGSRSLPAWPTQPRRGIMILPRIVGH